MLYVPCIFHVYCSQTNFVLVSFKYSMPGKQQSCIDPKKRYEHKTIDIQLNLTINPLNIKIFTIYKILSTEYITYVKIQQQKIYNLTTRSLLIKSQLIISAICGGNSQHTKAIATVVNFITWLYCTVLPQTVMLYVPCIFHVYCSQTNFVFVRFK